jgi:hypothetical protein
MANWKALLAGSAIGLGLLTTGCRIDTHKNGNKDDVKIATPFGGLSVKTDEDVVKEGVGLTVYPGATLVKKNGNKDQDAADVNIGFGGFRLRVQALTYQTSDSPDKVLAFYRNDMARYGTVILCRNNSAVGTPDHTQDGLTCDRDHNARVHVSEDEDAGEELKAGSKTRQHIVGIDVKGAVTKIGLVALELPSHIGNDGDKQ